RADVDRAINQVRIAEAVTIGDLTLDEARAEIRELNDEAPNLTPASYGADMLLAVATGADDRRMFRADILNALRDALPDISEANERESGVLLAAVANLRSPPTRTRAPIPATPPSEAAEGARRS